MNNKQKGMLMGSFVADSLALGAHWVYNTDNIDSKAGRVTELIDPLAANFHPKRSAGEFTHYGDQMLLFYNYMRTAGSFKSADYIKVWTDFYSSYDGYIDHAMRETNVHIAEGITPSGSDSTDLAGVLYVPVLAAFEAGDIRSQVENAVQMTHNSDIVKETAIFLAAILSDILSGARPMESINKNVNADYLSKSTQSLIQAGIDSRGKDTRAAITEFGPSCPADSGLPGAVHLIATYEDDFETGLIENVMAGGDSAARGLFAGAVLGAHNGLEDIPQRWIEGLKADIVFN